MTIEKRACANCANFDPAPEDGESRCYDQVTITIRPGVQREPEATDVCANHLTPAEDNDENWVIHDALRRGGPALATRAADAVVETRQALRRAALAW